MTTKKKIIAGAVILLAIGGGYYFFTKSGTEETVQTEMVKRGDVSETVSVTGELVPEEYADLSFVGAGTIDAVMVQAGQSVEQGAQIA